MDLGNSQIAIPVIAFYYMARYIQPDGRAGGAVTQLWALAKQKTLVNVVLEAHLFHPGADWAEIWGREKVDLCWGWIACPQILLENWRGP